MTKILVTGANGFVGHHLVKELNQTGHEVIAIGGRHGNEELGFSFKGKYLTLDLLNKDEVGQVDFSDVAGVVHLAGLAAVGPSFDDPLGYVSANVGMEINLIEAALAQQAKPRFVIISSGALYSPKAPLPLTEKSAVVPSSPYAVSKVGQEQMALYYNLRGIECIIARPFNHIGPGQNFGFIVPELTKQVLDFEQGKATAVKVGNLDAQRDYTDVRDIVRSYRLLLEKGKAGEIYNICSGRALSGHQILDYILKEVGVKAPIEQDPAKMRPSDSPVLYGSHEKLTKDTGWQPEIPIEATIADIIKDWRTRNDS